MSAVYDQLFYTDRSHYLGMLLLIGLQTIFESSGRLLVDDNDDGVQRWRDVVVAKLFGTFHDFHYWIMRLIFLSTESCWSGIK